MGDPAADARGPGVPDLVLIDGSSYLYRAFHALPPLTGPHGEPTGAVLGVLNMLLKSLREHDGAQFVVVFDAPGRTFRDDLFTAYKAHRPPMPDDLRVQIEPLLEAVQALGLPLLRISGVEADDVIGTLARRAADGDRRVLISTGDKDMAQLVGPYITLVNTMSDSTYDRDGVKAKFDVWPEQIIDYLALAGDSSDGIPGIDKVGPKTAAKWLNQYGSIDALIANADQVPGKIGENLRAGLDTLALSRQLATIRCDLDLPPEAADLARRPTDETALRTLYTRFGFKNLLRGLGVPDSLSATPDGSALVADPALLAAPRGYEVVLDEAALGRWLETLAQSTLFAFDTETTSLDYLQARIVGVSFCVEPGRAAYVPLGHDYVGAPEQLDRDAVLARLKPLLEAERPAKVGHHLKYDAHVLANHGIALGGMAYDTMLESYVWNSVATRHDMDSAAERYLGLKTITYEEVAGKGAKQIPFSQVSIETASTYAAEDADVTLRLHRTLWPAIEREPLLRRLYEDFEQPLVPVLQRMERRGVLIDREMLRRQGVELAKRAEELKAAAQAEAGTEFNVDSPKQLQQILYEKMNLPVLRKTPTGQPSTAEDVL